MWLHTSSPFRSRDSYDTAAKLSSRMCKGSRKERKKEREKERRREEEPFAVTLLPSSLQLDLWYEAGHLPSLGISTPQRPVSHKRMITLTKSSGQKCLFEDFEDGGFSFTRQDDCKAIVKHPNDGASPDPGCRLVRTWRTAVSRSLSPALRISCMHTLEVETSSPSQIGLFTDTIPLGFKTS